MLGTDIFKSTDYKAYKEALGTEFIGKLKHSIFTGGESNLKTLFVRVETVEIIERTPIIYVNGDAVSTANKEIRYGTI